MTIPRRSSAPWRATPRGFAEVVAGMQPADIAKRCTTWRRSAARGNHPLPFDVACWCWTGRARGIGSRSSRVLGALTARDFLAAMSGGPAGRLFRGLPKRAGAAAHPTLHEGAGRFEGLLLRPASAAES
jgi:hypothetical protein